MNSQNKNYLTIYSYICILYLASLIFLYPYGITVGSNNSIRITDIFPVILLFMGSLYILRYKGIRKNIFLFLIIPLFILELVLPVVGSVEYGASSVGSAFRIILNYSPFLLYSLICTTEETVKVNLMVHKVLKLGLIVNFVYSTVQILIVYGFLPKQLLLQQYLVNFAVDGHYKIVDGVRASGTFNNGIELSIFGVLAFCYFQSKLISKYSVSDLMYLLISILVVALSNTRTAMLAIAIIFIISFIFSPISIIKKMKIVLSVSFPLLIFFLIVGSFIDLEDIFYRVVRLGEGLGSDYSFSYRTNVIWPYVLEALQIYPVGTLTQPYNIFGVIDSGYLSYFAQGKWLFVLALLILIVGTILVATYILLKSKVEYKWVSLGLIFTIIYISFALVVYNLLRNPIVIAFILLYLVNLNFISTNSFGNRKKE
mgnify:CR=1 FL=1